MSSTFRRTALVTLVTAAILGVTAALPSSPAIPFHLRLVKSEPAANDSVASPKAVRLWFSLKPAMSITSIRLRSSTTVDIPLGKPVFAGDVKLPVEAAITQPLAPGRYTVSWKTASTDMHPVTGDFAFVVR